MARAVQLLTKTIGIIAFNRDHFFFWAFVHFNIPMKSLTSSFVDCPACFSGRIDGVSWHRHVPLPQNRKLWHRYPEEINHRYRNDCMRRIGVPSANGNGAPGDDISIIGDGPSVWTKFIAETLLPTSQGKFRLRGYRHTVSNEPLSSLFFCKMNPC